MPFGIDNRSDIPILKLEGAVTTRHAQELAALIAEDLPQHNPVSVDTQDLEDIDTCILQLLCSLKRTAIAVSFDNPSERFLNAIERCGLRRELIGAREGL